MLVQYPDRDHYLSMGAYKSYVAAHPYREQGRVIHRIRELQDEMFLQETDDDLEGAEGGLVRFFFDTIQPFCLLTQGLKTGLRAAEHTSLVKEGTFAMRHCKWAPQKGSRMIILGSHAEDVKGAGVAEIQNRVMAVNKNRAVECPIIQFTV